MMFAWISNYTAKAEYVQSNAAAALREVKNLQRGEQGTFDNLPRQEVPDNVVKRTLPFMSLTVAATVKLQRVIGIRMSEIYRMTVGDIRYRH